MRKVNNPVRVRCATANTQIGIPYDGHVRSATSEVGDGSRAGPGSSHGAARASSDPPKRRAHLIYKVTLYRKEETVPVPVPVSGTPVPVHARGK